MHCQPRAHCQRQRKLIPITLDSEFKMLIKWILENTSNDFLEWIN